VMVCLPVALIVAFLAEVFASILFPSNRLLCAEIIRISAFSLPLAALGLSMNVAMQATHAQNDAAKATVWASLTSIILSLWLIADFGLLGAALSQLTRPLLGCLACYRSFQRRFPNILEVGQVLPVIACGSVMGGFLWVGSRCLSMVIETLSIRGSWVSSRVPGIAATLSGPQTALLTAELLAWVTASLVLYIGVAIFLNIIPRKFVKKIFSSASAHVSD
jgi:peptidoglycan biosynthesis protein MviN/MurJ (putative lipid II flippase)